MNNWLPLLFGTLASAPWWIRALLPERLQEKWDKIFNPSGWKKLAIVCICISFIWSNFHAWNDEHNKLKALQVRLESPNFFGEINYTSILIEPTGLTAIIAGGLIRNPTGPPSGLYKWKMSIKLPNGNIITGVAPPAPIYNVEGNVPSHINKQIVLRADKYWPVNATSPITSGGALEGWFWSAFPDLNLEELYNENAEVIIEVMDIVANKPHEFKKSLRSGNDMPLKVLQSH